MSVDATFAALKAKLNTLVSYAAMTISFSGHTISDSASGLGVFSQDTRIQISGSAHNDGFVNVTNVAAGVITVLETLTTESVGAGVTLSWGPATFYDNPREAQNMGNFPSAVLALAPNVEDTMRVASEGDDGISESGLLRDEYTVAMYIFLGTRQQPLNEVHAKAKPWFQAVARILAKDITVGIRGTFLDVREVSTGDPILFKYRTGPILWSDGIYFGCTIFIPVVERFVP